MDVVKKKCKACPIFPETDEAEYALNLGCLPDAWDAWKLYEETGRAWACHCTEDNPKLCKGFADLCKEKGVEPKLDKPLLTTKDF